MATVVVHCDDDEIIVGQMPQPAADAWVERLAELDTGTSDTNGLIVVLYDARFTSSEVHAASVVIPYPRVRRIIWIWPET